MKSFKQFISEALDIKNNPNFWKWFGKSVAVDEHGDPLVMYHGTSHDFSTFKQSSRRAFFFTSCEHTAADYADRNTDPCYEDEDEEGLNASVYPVFIRLENPFHPDNPEHRAKIGLDEDAVGTWDWLEPYVSKMKSVGFDGMLVMEVHDADHVPGEYPDYKEFDFAVFDAKQIKSAIGNNGNFDPNDPDIRH